MGSEPPAWQALDARAGSPFRRIAKHPCKCCCCTWACALILPVIIGTAVDASYWASVDIPRLVFDCSPPDEASLEYREPTSEQELLDLLTDAASRGTNVRTIGGGWSWNPGAYPALGGIVVALRGELSRIDELSCSSSDQACTVTVGGGAWMKDIVPMIVSEGWQSSAKGLCLNTDASQTIGGVIATNVHHSFSPTFADKVISLRVAHFSPDGTAIATTYNQSDTQFGFTFGTVGRTGIVIGATLLLEPLQPYSWETLPSDGQQLSTVFSSEMSPSAECPAEMVMMVSWSDPVASITRRCAQPTATVSKNLDLEPVPPENYFKRDALEGFVNWDRVLFGQSIAARSFVATFGDSSELEGNWHADHVNIMFEQHLEMEMFVPFDDGARALEAVQAVVQSNGRWKNAVVALRQTPEAAAPLVPSAGADALAVNIDFFFDRDWDEFAKLQREILEAWRGLTPSLSFTRLHPGKFIAPGETLEAGGFPDTTIEDFYTLVDDVDPNGVFRSPFFARDDMTFVYGSRTPSKASAMAFVYWMLFLSACLGLILTMSWGALKCYKRTLK